ncbi:diguanylate cyclase domain-containing protein [Thermodesulfobacteriota bacterium]
MKDKKLVALLVESPDSSESAVKELLEKLDIEVIGSQDGIDAIRQCHSIEPDVIIADVHLPRLDGFQLARFIKSDPLMTSLPVIHLSSTANSMEHYWSKTSGGDFYLQKPPTKKELREIFNQFRFKKSHKRSLFKPASTITQLSDDTILSFVNNLLDRELLKANMLINISTMDVSGPSTDELVREFMSMLGQLFDYSLGVILFVRDQHGEFTFYQKEQVVAGRLEEITSIIRQRLQEQHNIDIETENVKRNIREAEDLPESERESDDLFIHFNENGDIPVVIAFDNFRMEDLREDEKEIFLLMLDHGRRVFEKKVLFQIYQESSIVDILTDGYSMAFFLEILKREIESATRNNYPLTLLTVCISNFDEIIKNLGLEETNDMIRMIQGIIHKIARKSDIVARWEAASFAFLLPQIAIEKGYMAQERICRRLKEELSILLPPSIILHLDTGIRQFDIEQDRTPEFFFAHAQPELSPHDEVKGSEIIERKSGGKNRQVSEEDFWESE